MSRGPGACRRSWKLRGLGCELREPLQRAIAKRKSRIRDGAEGDTRSCQAAYLEEIASDVTVDVTVVADANAAEGRDLVAENRKLGERAVARVESKDLAVGVKIRDFADCADE